MVINLIKCEVCKRTFMYEDEDQGTNKIILHWWVHHADILKDILLNLGNIKLGVELKE